MTRKAKQDAERIRDLKARAEKTRSQGRDPGASARRREQATREAPEEVEFIDALRDVDAEVEKLARNKGGRPKGRKSRPAAVIAAERLSAQINKQLRDPAWFPSLTEHSQVQLTKAIPQLATLAGAPQASAPCEVLGPAPAPIARLRGRYRIQLLIKHAKREAVWSLARHISEATSALRGELRASVDMSPVDML